ncbi:MAG: hypothetical protein V4616_04230 [Bacteroidota bacterium]
MKKITIALTLFLGSLAYESQAQVDNTELVAHYTLSGKTLVITLENKTQSNLYIADLSRVGNNDELPCPSETAPSFGFWDETGKAQGVHILPAGRKSEVKFRLPKDCKPQNITLEYSLRDPIKGRPTKTINATLPPQSLIK